MSRKVFNMKVRARAGYTIVEMLVAVFIFSMAFVAISAIFLSFTTTQARTGNAQRLLNESNFLFESVAREIRNNTIDYNCPYSSYATNDAYICLKTLTGQAIHIKYVAGDVSICQQNDATLCDSTMTANWTSLVPSSITVTSMRFAVYPTVSPIGKDVPSDQVYHPLTRLYLSVESGRGKSKQSYDFETAVSTRYYTY